MECFDRTKLNQWEQCVLTVLMHDEQTVMPVEKIMDNNFKKVEKAFYYWMTKGEA